MRTYNNSIINNILVPSIQSQRFPSDSPLFVCLSVLFVPVKKEGGLLYISL